MATWNARGLSPPRLLAENSIMYVLSTSSAMPPCDSCRCQFVVLVFVTAIVADPSLFSVRVASAPEVFPRYHLETLFVTRSFAPGFFWQTLELRLASHSLGLAGCYAARSFSVVPYFVLSHFVKFAWNSLR